MGREMKQSIVFGHGAPLHLYISAILKPNMVYCKFSLHLLLYEVLQIRNFTN